MMPKETMPYAHVESSQLHEVLQSLDEHKRVMAVMKTMALEIERLTEDNAQLRAAVSVYREVVRRYTGKAVGSAEAIS